MPKNFWIDQWSNQVCGIIQARLRPGKTIQDKIIVFF